MGARMDLRIDIEKDIAYLKLSGKIDKDTFLYTFELTVSDENYKKGMGRIWDLRDANLSCLQSKTLVEIAQYPNKFPAGINDVKVAFVAHRDIEFGLARMVEMSSLGATEIRVFRTMDQAKEWMTEP
jgi:hypothetical protein